MDRRRSQHEPQTELEALLLALVNSLPGLMFVKDTSYRYLFVNQRFTSYGPTSVDDMIGKTDHDIVPAEIADRLRVEEALVQATQAPRQYEEEVETPVGRRHFLTVKFPVQDRAGALIGLAGVVTDITDQKQVDAAERADRERLIAQQQATLRQLATPILPIADDVLAMPLVGSIDGARAAEILGTLLQGIAARRARTVILDVTGLEGVDADVARTLLDAARASRLLGAEVMLTGVRPAVARTLVELGVDFAELKVCATLAAGIAEILDRR